jgi:predicted nucleic acid-binding protein
MTLRYLLDTCVVSEFAKQKPEKKVVEWLNQAVPELMCLSVVTLGEIQSGVSELPVSNRRTQLEEWLSGDLAAQFEGRVIPLDAEIFLVWGEMYADLKKRGKPMGIMDSLIAATALHHKMVLVTRNVTDFSSVALNIFNPWE